MKTGAATGVVKIGAIKKWLWNGFCVGVMLAVFGLTLLLGWPVARLLERLPLPDDLKLGEVSGNLMQGRIGTLAGPGWQAGPLTWRLSMGRPTTLKGELLFSGQYWQLALEGWPWQWRGKLQPESGGAGFRPPTDTRFQWQGQWSGAIEVQGRDAACLSADGALHSDNLRLTAPLTADFGAVDLRLICADAVRIRVAGQGIDHRLVFDVDLSARRSRLTGSIGGASPLAEPAVQLGLLKPGRAQVKKGWRW